jgi:EmrB/QacA subfamily drug resistance transporter
MFANSALEMSATTSTVAEPSVGGSVAAGTDADRAPSAGHPRRWLILAVVLAAECMDLFDGTIVNVAAPTIRTHLHASSTGLVWIVGGYPLAIAVGLITGGRLGDLYGRRSMFLVGASGFTLASLACAVAPSTGFLIAARLVQGVAGALMLPQGLGIVKEVFPPDEVGGAYAIFGPVIGSAAVFGPIIGGGLIDLNLFHMGWRLIFLVNLPLGAAAVAGAMHLLPRTRSSAGSRLDLPGTTLLSVALVLLVYPLIQGRSLGWPAWTYASMGLSVVALLVFAFSQRALDRRGGDPLVLPSIFAQRGYSAGLAVAIVLFATMIALLLTLSLFVQLGEGFSAIHAGLSLVPLSVGLAVGAGLSGGLLGPRFGRTVLQAGTVVFLAGVGLLLVAIPGSGGGVSTWDLLPGELVGGLGIGLIVAPLFDVILAAVGDHETGSASGVLGAAQQLAGAIGVAVLGTVFFTVAAHGNFAGALRRTLWIEAGMLVVMLALTPLLPRRARDPESEATRLPA